MSKVSIDLDLSVVQKVIHAKVRPAVDEILAKVDLEDLITKELLKPSPKSENNLHYLDMIYYSRFADYNTGTNEPLINRLVTQQVQEAAKAYVAKAIKADMPKIEDALRRMMAKSTNPLVHALLASLENALNDDWQFTISTEMAPKQIERDGYGD